MEIAYDEEIKKILRTALEVEEKKKSEYPDVANPDDLRLAWEWYEVNAAPQTLNRLVRAGILKIVYKSNKSTMYRIANHDKVKQILFEQPPEIEVAPEPSKIPDDLFDCIVGHDDIKEILMRSITSESSTHILLWGSIASAKTLFCEELARLPNCRFVIGSSLTKAGLAEVLFNEKPRYLVIDELDKVEGEENIAILLSLMERGIITETKYRRHRSIKLKTTVFASANRIDNLPAELLSRFVRLRFRDYTPEEFIEVAVDVLTKREGTSPQISFYIAEKVLKELGSRDVRDAVKIARLIKKPTREEVDHVVNMIKQRK
ncbi:MAG: hypothetical protein QXI11_00870 [Thermoproteota archaeon]